MRRLRTARDDATVVGTRFGITAAMESQTLNQRVSTLERKMSSLETLPERVNGLELQFSQFRDEVRAEFSATRAEMVRMNAETRADMVRLNEETRAEMVRLNDETRRHMLVLHEEVIGRLTVLSENGRKRASRTRAPKTRRG
jgi:hypothetical protein